MCEYSYCVNTILIQGKCIYYVFISILIVKCLQFNINFVCGTAEIQGKFKLFTENVFESGILHMLIDLLVFSYSFIKYWMFTNDYNHF